VTAQLILQPDLGGNSIRSTAVAGTGEAPTVIQGTNLYYDCNFSVTFANVPSGTYAAALVLTGSQVENLYSSDPSAWYSTGNSVGGILTINLNDSITVTNNNLTTLKLITLDAAT